MDEFDQVANRIKNYFDDLDSLKAEGVKTKTGYYATSMVLFSILNDCITLAELFMSKRQYSAPMSYKEMVELLEAKNILSPPVSKKMKLLFSKRNLIAHEYGTINESDIILLSKEMGWAKKFVSELYSKYK